MRPPQRTASRRSLHSSRRGTRPIVELIRLLLLLRRASRIVDRHRPTDEILLLLLAKGGLKAELSHRGADVAEGAVFSLLADASQRH